MNVENDHAIINNRSRDDHLLLFFKRGLVNGYGAIALNLLDADKSFKAD
jgi:hypothetical protein